MESQLPFEVDFFFFSPSITFPLFPFSEHLLPPGTCVSSSPSVLAQSLLAAPRCWGNGRSACVRGFPGSGVRCYRLLLASSGFHWVWVLTLQCVHSRRTSGFGVWETSCQKRGLDPPLPGCVAEVWMEDVDQQASLTCDQVLAFVAPNPRLTADLLP